MHRKGASKIVDARGRDEEFSHMNIYKTGCGVEICEGKNGRKEEVLIGMEWGGARA